MQNEESDIATQDLDEKSPSTPPSEAPSEADAAEDLPGIPEEAEEQRRERGDE